MGSLFNAMTTAVSGLSAQSSAMSNISNNIANAQTTGFKGRDTLFADLVNNSGAGTYEGGGAQAVTQTSMGVQGTLATASSSTNMAISGSGFFGVKTGGRDASGTVTFNNLQQFTRRGDFSLDSNGYMVNGTGGYLEGYAVNQSTKIADTSAMVPIQIARTTAAPIATSSITLAANLPANIAAVPAGGTSTLAPTSTQIYDATGTAHTVNINWTKTADAAWTAEISIPDASGGFDHSLNATFGSTAGGKAGTLQTLTNTTGSTAFTVPAGGAGTDANVGFSVDFGSGAQAITLKLGSFNETGGLTQFSASSQQVDIASQTQDGVPLGTFQNLSIDKSGNVTANYSNGLTQSLYQVPVIQFNNPEGLQELSSGNYVQTGESGLPKVGAAGANGAGTVNSGMLEASNVDIAEQFTRMIQTQQVYSANSKTITTANQMLSDVINIIRA